jgi:ribonucleoside-diphosphate reductase alpha chain
MGVPNEPCILNKSSTTVFSFPKAAPKGAVQRNELTATRHLQDWLKIQEEWCEHKPSATVYVQEDEWVDVAAWTYKHFDNVSGISFLPFDGGRYKQAPYEEITEEQHKEMLSQMPKSLDWNRLADYEKEDNTSSSQTFACSSGACEIVDIGG